MSCFADSLLGQIVLSGLRPAAGHTCYKGLNDLNRVLGYFIL